MPWEVIVAVIIGTATVSLGILSHIALWQRKEYRWDRLRSYIFSPEGSVLRQPILLIRFALIGTGWTAFLGNMHQLAAVLGWAALVSWAWHHGRRVQRQGIVRPKWTTKAVLLAGVMSALILVYVGTTYILGTLDALQWATVVLILPVAAAVGVWAVNIPASVRQRSIIRQASQYRAQLPRLTVVGITGSYGKTSAKHFLQQLLEGSGMRVVATKNHRNSELSVAQDMLEQLKTSTDVYVVEMGAYARGEIAALTALVRPRIGVITAIGNQHLALFGSKQNVTAAKWELIQGLPVGGIAVLNTDDPVIRGKSRADTHKSVRYSGTGRADVYASDIVVGPVSLSATLHIAPKEKKVVIPLASRGLLSSLLGALAAAHALGVASTHLFRQVEKVAALERTMQILAGPSGVSVLDDSYSANEAGVINALNHIRLFPQADKRVLLVPLIELGEDGPSVHERVGKTLATIPAKVYIYGTAYKQDFLRGLKQRTKHVGWITTPAELLSEATKDISTDTLFLLEGRIPDVVRKAVIDPRSKV